MSTISTLNAGDKIAITEASGTALYTLVHHNYNDGYALLLRDAAIGTSQWRTSGPSSYGDNIYDGSELDTYLEAWYDTLPTKTTKYLSALNYPVEDNNAGGEQILLTRRACTVSLGESESSSSYTNYTNIGQLEYTDTLNIGVAWWTRQPTYASNNAFYISESGYCGYSYKSYVTTSYNVRPTLGVSEDQEMEYSDDLGAYVFASTNRASYFYHCENGELVPYRLYHCEKGVLVPYNLYKCENGELVQY